MHLDATIYAAIGLLFGPMLFARSFGRLRLRRLIQNTPTARIRSMAMGLVEVNGLVRARSALIGPFSGRPCVHWDVEIAVSRRRGAWSTVHRNSSGNPFFLEDETGTALVYPRGATCKVRFSTDEECVGVALPECYSRYMSEQRLMARFLWRLGALRFTERLLEEGQRVYVLGTAVPHAQAYTVSEGEAFAATGTDGPPPRVPRVRAPAAVIRRGESAFLISQDSERDLVFDMGARAVIELIAGPALTLFGIGLLLQTLPRH